MVGEISTVTRTEVLRAIRNRYREASKKDKSRMLDEFELCHRKHAVSPECRTPRQMQLANALCLYRELAIEIEP